MRVGRSDLRKGEKTAELKGAHSVQLKAVLKGSWKELQKV
jgi:hypothetical protein